MKSKAWRKDRYFVQVKSRDWIFKSENKTLLFASDFKIKRHVLIKFDENPYLVQYQSYYSKRKLANR